MYLNTVAKEEQIIIQLTSLRDELKTATKQEKKKINREIKQVEDHYHHYSKLVLVFGDIRFYDKDQ